MKPTSVFDTYWKFAAERQAIFFRKLEGRPGPWTDDPILRAHKFTNAYRAADRVSQYLIRRVIYAGDQAPREVFFRTVLFRLFNKIETWELLRSTLGEIRSDTYQFAQYANVVEQAMRNGTKIYSAAYIMPARAQDLRSSRKHENHLRLLERMMRERIAERVMEAPNLRDVFLLLRSLPMLGDFLAYQLAIDLNYGPHVNHSEMAFVVPGPGAYGGIRKCFSDLGGCSEADVIRCVCERQEEEFKKRGLLFQTLWGRPLQLIDCQNLFCEVNKYARLAHPDIPDPIGRTRIKQKYRPISEPIEYWFPPKWRLKASQTVSKKMGSA
ncbi:hypothetical protein HY734_03670 [Candidatus Uhrbacteria bacterium]|nr:hypothetical protein [Candidatus Uhrbacteria bacterium]